MPCLSILGVVQEIKAEDLITVDFGKPHRNPGELSWPDGKDIQLVDVKFILASAFEPVTKTGRIWTIPDSDNIAGLTVTILQDYSSNMQTSTLLKMTILNNKRLFIIT
jgi:hypothetical protein